MFARPRADVDDPIRFLDGVLVVFDHDHRVPQVAETVQRVDETPVVTLVQTDARFVEHVQGPDETGTDLAGETYALGLAAGERARRA